MDLQTLRAIDVFYLGPSMAYAGMLPARMPGWLRLTLIAGGILTMAYNGTNYLREAKRGKL